MVGGGPAEFETFWRQQASPLVRWLVGRAASRFDAEDAAQEALFQVHRRWEALEDPRAYLYSVARNELSRQGRAARREHDLAARVGGAWIGRDSVEDIDHQMSADIVRECLTQLSDKQGRILALRVDGFPVGEAGRVLNMTSPTARSTLRHARRNASHVMRGDDTARTGSCPLVSQSWERSRDHHVDPEHGTSVAPLPRDEVRDRWQASLFANAGAWACRRLQDVARRDEQMLVVLDGEGWVLRRAGERTMLRKADRLGFVEGALWREDVMGTNAAGLALVTGRRAQVKGGQHYVADQHELACWASPVVHPRSGQVLGVLNLTGLSTRPDRDFLRQVDDTARELERHLSRR